MSQPYSPIATSRAMSQEMYPAAYRDYGIPTPAPMAPGGMPGVVSNVTSTEAPAGTQTGGPPKYADYLLGAESQLGRKLTQEELLQAREQYKHNIFVPENLRRGAKSYQMDLMLEAFESNAELVDQQYMTAAAQAAEAAQAAPDKYGNSATGETLASFIGGAVNTAGPGLLSLVDQTMRMSPAVGLYNLATGGDRQGILGRTAEGLRRNVDSAVDQYRTYETELAEQKQAGEFERVSNDENATVGDWIGAALSGGPRVLRRQIAGVLGGMAPGIGGVSKARGIIDQLPKAAQRLTRAFALGGPQSANNVNSWETEQLERPIEEFGPEVQAASRDAQEAGIPKEEADRLAKQTAVSAARPLVALTSYAANVGLAAIPGFGVSERLITRSGAPGNLVGRVVGASAEEAVEETAAGALEQFGLNAGRAYTGQNVPLGAGVKQAAAQGGVLGAIVGGGSGVVPQPSPPVAPTPTPTPTPQVVPPPVAPPPAGATPPPAGTGIDRFYTAGPGVPEADLDGIKKKIAETLATKLAPRTSAMRKAAVGFDAQMLIDAAQAQAVALAGDKWQNMSAIQKLDAVETAAEAINKVTKWKGPELTSELTATRELINQAANPPTNVTATPVPAGVTGTPTTGTKRPLRKTPAPPAAATATTNPDSPVAAAAPTADPNDPTFDSLDAGAKLTAAEGMVSAWNAANPKAPITIGAAVTALTPANTAGKTISQLTSDIGKLAAPAATPAPAPTPAPPKATKPLRKPVPKPPAATTAAPATATATPAAAPATPAPAPAKPAGPETVIDAVNRILKTNNASISSVSAVIDAVNEFKKTGSNAPLMAALKTVPNVTSAQLTELLGLGKKQVPAPPAKTEAPKTESKKGLKKAVPAAPAKTEAPKEEPKKGLKKAVPAPPANTEAPTPPADLEAAKPHTSVGAKRYTLEFENSIDKALYLLSNKDKWTKADAEYVDFVTKSLGINKNEAQFEGQQLRERVRALAAAHAKDVKNTGKVIKVPSGVAPSPKPQAPAGAGAEGSSAKPANKTETISEAVTRITNNELAASEEAELVEAVKLGRESQDPGPISAAIKQLEEDGAEFTADQKRDLRLLATPQATAEPTVENAPEPVPEVEDEPSSFLELDADLPDLREQIKEAISKTPSAKRMGAVLDIVAKSKHSTKFQKWLARKLSPMMEAVGATVKLMPPAKGKHGSMDADRHIIINTARPSTILHEALHAVTLHAMHGRLRINGDYTHSKYLEAKWDKLEKYAKQHIRDNPSILDGLNAQQKARVAAALGKKGELVTYAFTDKTARLVFTKIPASEPTKYSSLWDEFKTILTEWYQTIFNADISQRTFLDQVLELGALTAEATAQSLYNTDPAIDTALESLSQDMRLEEVLDADPVSASEPTDKKLEVRTTPVKAAQRIWELFSVASLGIEKAMQDVIASGGEILAEYNPYYAMRKYTSDMAEMKNIDNLEVVEPVRNWIVNNWRKFGSKNAAEFRKDLDKFLQNYHMLTERNPTIWAETVPLTGGAELTRAELIDDAYAGNITGQQLNARLISLAGRHAKQTLDEWSEETKLGKSNKALRETLADLKKKGFDESTLQQFNELTQHIRDRARMRMIASGRVDEGDPFANRGWEWYVPLKGHLSVSEEAADYDIGSQRGETKSFRNSNLKVLQGRQSNANNAITQLVEDMNNAATAAAEGEFTSKLFEFAVLNPKNKEILGAKYTRYYGTPKSGYYAIVKKVDKKTGKVTYVPGRTHAELKQPKSGFIYHNGNEHYVVYLPNDSQLNRGVSGLRRVLTPTILKEGALLEKPLKGVGMVTNIMARAYTTWSPIWQLMIGFLRDTSTLPTTVAVTVFDSPLKATAFAGRYMANLVANTAQLSKLDKTWASLWGNKAALKKYVDDRIAKKLPDDLFVKIYKYREAGGSTEFAQGLNKDRADDLLFGNLEFTVGGKLAEGYDKWNEVTSNWAALLENVGRVSAWEALVAEGKSPYEAAVIAKSALDYGQSGEWGRMINLWHAFFRVGATSLDVIRRAFTTPTGEVDTNKLMKWAPFFMSMGVVAYFLQAAILGDDEDGEERIKKMDANTLTQRVIFPGMGDDANSYPIGLGLPQLLLTPGILGAAVQNGHISPAEAVEAYYGVLLRSSPVQPTGVKKDARGPLAFGMSWVKGLLVGTPVRPGLEIDNNTNAFGNTVHTEWIDKAKDRADQGMPGTGQEWKDIAQAMRNGIFGMGIDMFPEDYAHLARGYGGQVASEIVRWTIDKDKREMEGVDSSAIRTSLRLGVTDEDYYYRNEARDVKDELNISRRRLNAALADGMRESAWLSQNPGDRRRIAEWKALDKAQDTYYEDIARIRDNKLLSAEGRRLQKKRADSRLRQAVERAQRVIDASAD